MSARADHKQHVHAEQHGHGTCKSYLTGFALSAVLTFIPFWLVMTRPGISATVIVMTVIVLAVLQILVHTISFLHVNTTSEGGWTLLAYAFTTVLLLITIVGSLWIMYHLNSNMMPGMDASAEAGATP